MYKEQHWQQRATKPHLLVDRKTSEGGRRSMGIITKKLPFILRTSSTINLSFLTKFPHINSPPSLFNCNNIINPNSPSFIQPFSNTFNPHYLTFRLFNTHYTDHQQPPPPRSLLHETTEGEEGETDGWEEEEDQEIESKAGDGGDGGGVMLQGVPWGERALSLAREVLLQFGDGIDLFAFKTTMRGYVYVRLDKLSNEYGCPSMEELESYCQAYKKRLEEVGALGEIPDNLALEVSSPGAERILKVPDDLCRFKHMPMRVCYVEGLESNGPDKDGVFFLDSIEKESDNCVWKLADVKENRDPESKGRPLSRKRRDWRLKLPFEMHKRVTLYLEF